ncbi:MAG TPA: T9SS type A sorting domain-containing protein [Bacteroidia bacterium]|jgi:hypothetical protein|nr:T9SS type A sorting domain-containing protein [Bacteroidia bacterium]
MKKTLSIIIACIVLFVSCTKDAPAYPVAAQPIVTPHIPVTITDNISPNPCIGTFTIQTNTTDSQTVLMYDVTGREELNLIINGTTAIVDNNLPNGIYYIKITNKAGIIMRKLIVMR